MYRAAAERRNFRRQERRREREHRQQMEELRNQPHIIAVTHEAPIVVEKVIEKRETPTTNIYINPTITNENHATVSYQKASENTQSDEATEFFQDNPLVM